MDGVLTDTEGGGDVFGGSRAYNLASSVDGVPTLFYAVATPRTQSPPFRIEIGEEDVFDATQGTVVEAALSDGLWVMLPLPKGEHTLHVQAALCDVNNQHLGGFRQDYTYHLRVE